MNYIIFSTSLNPNSRGFVLAKDAQTRLEEKGHTAELIDLREYDLPLCDGNESYNHKNVQTITQKVKNADGILLTVPIYNYNVSAAAKNLIELTGKSWSKKVVGLLASAGGDMSYLSVMPIITSLMIDFRCIVLPRYVYTTGSSFNQEQTQIIDEKISERLNGLTQDFIDVTMKLK